MFSELVTEEHITIPHDMIGGIFRAKPTDAASAIGVVAMAFSTDPVARWVYPEAADYLTWFPHFIRAFAGRAFDEGTAYCAGGFSGAALWLPPGSESDGEAVEAISRGSVKDAKLDELFEIFEQMDAHHPKQPHWYLPMIGVDVFSQGKGVGSALMRYALARCDEEGLPAYLESTNPRNISLYTRFGFEIQGQIQVGSCPPIFPMLRTARGWVTAVANDGFVSA
jgi:ribosomal protein S18 acetylase RimI-like enzyme